VVALEALTPATGWGVLHLFCTPTALADAPGVVAAVKACQADDHQVIGVALLGHKADIGLMALGPDLSRLRRLQSEVVAAGLEVRESYVSLTEISEYAQGVPEELKEARLHPQLPPAGKRAWCFYPMSKRREVGANWFTLDYDARKALMYEHGASGRRFAGRVLQVVTGSTGLDEYEWGVTLFAERPDDLKEVVYTMRYDQASALYAEFGPFYTGIVAPVEDILAELGVV